MSATGRTRRRSALLVLALLSVAATALGDGAHMQLTQAVGPFVITLFTAPTPLRSGPVQVSLLVQTRADRARCATPTSTSSCARSPRCPAGDHHAAQRGVLPNKVLYGAEVVIPTMGRWRLTAHVSDGERAQTCPVTSMSPPRWPRCSPSGIHRAALRGDRRLRAAPVVEGVGASQRPIAAPKTG